MSTFAASGRRLRHQAFLTLLPQGQAWPEDIPARAGSISARRGPSPNTGASLADGRAADLLERESDPRSTIELLPDWERNWGLPDPCYAGPLTIHDRQLALVLRMTMLGGQSRQFFIDVAAFLGYTITITEYAPFMAGVSNCGDTRTPPLTGDQIANPLEGDFRWYIGPPELRFYWTVHVTGARLTWFQGEPRRDRLVSIIIWKSASPKTRVPARPLEASAHPDRFLIIRISAPAPTTRWLAHLNARGRRR